MTSSSKIAVSTLSALVISTFLLAGYLLSRSVGSDISRLAAGESPYERRKK